MSYKYLNETRILKLRCVVIVVATTASCHIWVQETVDEVVSYPTAVM
jgi:hypothetical protein